MSASSSPDSCSRSLRGRPQRRATLRPRTRHRRRPGDVVRARAARDGHERRQRAGRRAGSLLLGPSPSTAELAAAAEVAARLGFETMAMDLPIARGDGGAIPIVIGRSGLAASGITAAGLDPTSLDSGEGAVGVVVRDGRTWVIVSGGDDEGLLAAARLFAGVLPHTRTLSTASLTDVREDLAARARGGGYRGGLDPADAGQSQDRSRRHRPTHRRTHGRRSRGSRGCARLPHDRRSRATDQRISRYRRGRRPGGRSHRVGGSGRRGGSSRRE